MAVIGVNVSVGVGVGVVVVVCAGEQVVDVQVEAAWVGHAGRGEFDRQGEAVQAAAQAGRCGAVGGGEREARDRCRGSVGEEREGRVAVGRGEVAVRIGGRQRPYVQQVFLGQAQAVPAGGEDTYAGGAVQECAGEFGAGSVQVFAVVEDQEEAARSQLVGQGVRGLRQMARGVVVQAQRLGGGPRYEVRVGQTGQLHETDAVREGAGHACRDTGGEARLADAARPGQGDEAGSCQQGAGFGLFGAAVDEARGLDGRFGRCSADRRR